MGVIGFVLGIVGCIVGVLVVAAAVAVGLPVFTLVALTMAIWAGEPRVPSFLLPSQKPAEAGAEQDLLDAFAEEDPAEEPAASAPASGTRSSIQIGWRRHPDQAVALRSYYFGPLADDLVGGFRAVYLIWKGVRELASDAVDSIDRFDSGVPRVVIPFSIYVGLPVGMVIGLAVTLVVGLTYVVISALTLVIALCLIFVLRGLDTLFCFLAGIARICLDCGDRVATCPRYLCPDCGRQHDDIRPGGYGVLRRRCVCGQPMPTTLLTGAAALQGICPLRGCNGYLPPMWGRARVVVVPLFGATQTGKTRLMYMMTTALRDQIRDLHGQVTYIGDTGERLDMIRDSLALTGHTEKTIVERPRGLGLFVKVKRTKRLVYFFDAAGEFYTHMERITELKYLNKARTYIFAADPLAAKTVWSQFPASTQESLQRVRTGRGEVEKSFQATINQMHRIAERRRFRRNRSDLAFAVTKLDLMRSNGVDVSSIVDSTDEWVRSEDGLNMGNLARRAEHSFSAVNYCCTAAIETDGQVDSSVQKLLGEILDRGGLELKE
jgi:hypothetical protein